MKRGWVGLWRFHTRGQTNQRQRRSVECSGRVLKCGRVCVKGGAALPLDSVICPCACSCVGGQLSRLGGSAAWSALCVLRAGPDVCGDCCRSCPACVRSGLAGVCRSPLPSDASGGTWQLSYPGSSTFGKHHLLLSGTVWAFARVCSRRSRRLFTARQVFYVLALGQRTWHVFSDAWIMSPPPRRRRGSHIFFSHHQDSPFRCQQ